MPKKTQVPQAELTLAANAKFEALSKPEKRVAIARDVLAQLKAKKFTAECGVYLAANDDRILYDTASSAPETELQKLIPKLENCHVCAIGGLFLSMVSIHDRLNVGSTKGAPGREEMVDYLGKFFSRDQLDEIERAFELDKFFPFPGEDESASDQYQEHDNLRLRLIMENIIANKGTFKPSKRPVTTISTPGFTG